MQKKLIALAVAGLVSGGAFAQSNVTIYGIVDIGMETGNSGYGSKTRIVSGTSAGSRLGFKGEEALGNGMTAFFTLETGFTPNNGQTSSNGSLTQSSAVAPAAAVGGANTGNVSGGSYAFQRQGVLGIKGAWGQVTAGRQYTPAFWLRCTIDVEDCGKANSQSLPLGSWTGYADRLDSSVYYWTPNLSGFTGAIGYSSGLNNNSDNGVAATAGSAANKKNGETWGAIGQYGNGPVYVGLAYHRAKIYSAAVAALAANALFPGSSASAAGAADSDVGTAKGWLLGGTYDFGVAKLSVGYGQGKLESANAANTINTQLNASDGNRLADNRIWSLGVRIPMGANRFSVTWGKFDSKLSTDKDWTHWGLGYEYAMSKRTALYASWAKVTNKDQSAFGGAGQFVPGALNNQDLVNNPLGSGPNYDPSALQLGVRHSF